MRRRQSLVILVALSVGAAIAFSVRMPVELEEAGDTAEVPRDSLAQTDSQPSTALLEVEEPPCVASRLGLPCR